MIITSIEEQKKKGRFNIFLDGEFAFGLYKETIYDFGLRVKDDLTEDKINEIKCYDEINFGKKVAIRFLNYKQRTEKEVHGKLKSHKLSEESINKIMIFLKEFKFVNDENYAKLFVESKKILKPEGRRTVRMKLAQKGINKELSERSVSENYSEEEEFIKAKELFDKYRKKVRGKNEADKKQKCYRFLLSKGFSYDLIRDVMRIEDT